MKAFISKILKFISYGFILLNLILLAYSSIIKKQAKFDLHTKPKMIVAGHSHPECAYNDSLITDFKNIAYSGESYFHTFQKIKQVINHNPSIKIAFIEYGNNNITKRLDDWVWKDEYISTNPVYYNFMTLEDKYVLLSHNLTGFINLNSNSIKESTFNILKNDYNYNSSINGYRYLLRSKTDSIIDNAVKDDYVDFSKFSEININYLAKIITFCRENNVEPILIRSPLHPKYQGYINEKSYKSRLQKEYSNVSYLDFSKFPLSNAEFGDLEHLNHKGAKIFSLWFNELLEKGLLNKKDKQTLINSEIEKIN